MSSSPKVADLSRLGPSLQQANMAKCFSYGFSHGRIRKCSGFVLNEVPSNDSNKYSKANETDTIT